MPDPFRQDFGGSLREARLRAGITLGDIAGRTKISRVALEALERNQVSRLPGGVFTRAFVRAYAAEVGLDPEETLALFLRQFPDASPDALAPAPPDRLEPDPRPGTSAVRRAAIWLLPLLAIAYVVGSDFQIPRWWRSPPPSSPSAPAIEPAAAPAVDLPVSRPPVQPVSADVPAGTAALPVTPDAAWPAGGAPAAIDPDLAAPVPEGVMRLAVEPTAPCWLSVRADGKTVFSGIVAAGERREFDLRGEVVLTAGDAGALVFTVNGQPGRRLGGAGRVATARFSLATVAEFLDLR
ncbi:MAG TPA: RodZ domain-containing protein [Vicinamibacterales bacterium]|nr:RodZ domain-containing protein [Vicinamibacterales bacterium]